MIRYDGFKRTAGTKIHVAADGGGLPISIRTSFANIHDSTKFIDVMENISECLDGFMMEEIVAACAEKVYDSMTIKNYLRDRSIIPCIPKRNFKKTNKKKYSYKNYKICS